VYINPTIIAELKDWNYSHSQSTPATAWTVQHNLGVSGVSGSQGIGG